MASAEQAIKTVYRPPEFTSGTWTSWIPLVTPYSGHAPQCSTKVWRYGTAARYVAWDPGFGISVQDLHCVPEAATTVWDQDRLGSNSDTILSIGPITCPEAFSQVTTSVKDESMTLVACCPLGYNFRRWASPGTPGECTSDIASGDTITYYSSDNKKTWSPYTLQFNSSTTVIGAHINGWIFAADQTSAQSPPLPTTTDYTCSPRQEVRSPGGINTSSAIVLGIGIALMVVGLIVLASGIVIMRRSKKAQGRAARSAARAASSTTSPSQETPPPRGGPIQQQAGLTYGGGLFPPVPGGERRSPSLPAAKEPQELDGFHHS